jgi:long-chain fatty acid transport protein
MNRFATGVARVSSPKALAAFAGACLLLSSQPARAAGYALDVLAGRATGMATAVTGMIDDSSAVFFNPAGIAQGRSFDAQLGASLIAPSVNFKDTHGQSTQTPFKVLPPFSAYASGGITDNLSIGIGVFTPFGLTVEWPGGWEGRSIIRYAQLATYYINPTVAYRLGPLRLGAGVQIVRATVDLQRDIGVPGGYGATELGAATWGLGGNAGLQIEAVPKFLSFGAQYRSAVPLSFDGNAHFDGIPAELAGTIHDQAVSTRIVNPDTFSVGAAVHPIDKLVVDADVVYYGWGHTHSVDINFPNDTTGSLSTTQPKSWKSGVNVHLGGEYVINDTWQVRAGALYDPSPSPSNTLTPDIPDADRLNLALGATYRHCSGIHLDVGYQFLFLFTKTSTAPQLPGEYSGFVNILGLSLGYSSKASKPAQPQ